MAYESPAGYERLDIITLPKPQYDGKRSVENALHQRRSVRTYANAPITGAEVSQLLWAAQGITSADGLRTVPSAGALYPLTVYLVVGSVQTFSKGIYKYQPQRHELVRVMEGDKRAELSAAALQQGWVKDSAVVIVLSAMYECTTGRYGERGIRYVHMEVGHAAQNIYLQAVALNPDFSDLWVRLVFMRLSRPPPLKVLSTQALRSPQSASNASD